MTRTKADSNIVLWIIGALVFLVTGVTLFVRKALKAGRGKELFTSSLYLSCAYLLMWGAKGEITLWWLWLIPSVVFSIYWVILFSKEKITSLEANPNWANRDWWWSLDGWEFEEEVAKIFRLNGYIVEVTKKTGDGGVDLIMWNNDTKIAVQCKHYKSPIPVTFARELNGVKDDIGAQELIIVASSGATAQCYDFLGNKPYFKILDLEDMIRFGLRPTCHRL